MVDRRIVLEEREKQSRQEAFDRLEEGSVVRGTVRSITDFGAFIDLGGVDGLLHVSDMSYTRGMKKPWMSSPSERPSKSRFSRSIATRARSRWG